MRSTSREIQMNVKPPLLLLHAALGSAAQLEPLANLLRERFLVLTLDFEGHGLRAAPLRPLRNAGMAENVIELLDARGLDSVPIFGHSMGGYVALYLCAHYPERIAGVHTLGTYFDWEPVSAARMLQDLDADQIEAKVPKYAVALDARHRACHWRDVVSRTAEMIHKAGENADLKTAMLAEIHQPVRIGVGDRDTLTPVESCAAVARALPLGELVVFPRTTHPIERAPLDELARSIQSFSESVTNGC
jgi:pimeloyl-ACP methyl ester carboxylesterase